MSPQNLSSTERAFSASLGAGMSLLALRRTSPWIRLALAVAGAGLIARAATGRCALKAALLDPAAQRHNSAVDATVEASFPASDPPASRHPDEPPSNAEDKWAAARAAGKAE